MIAGIFSFNSSYYKQVDGVTMGSPLGPALANLFLGHLEKNWLSETFSPVHYRRYADDIFCVFDDEEKADLFLDFLNSRHANLKFTIEKGNKKIPFLDTMVNISDKFEVSVYRKPTHTV